MSSEVATSGDLDAILLPEIQVIHRSLLIAHEDIKGEKVHRRHRLSMKDIVESRQAGLISNRVDGLHTFLVHHLDD